MIWWEKGGGQGEPDKEFRLRVKNEDTNFNKDRLKNTISKRIRGTIFQKILITFVIIMAIYITK